MADHTTKSWPLNFAKPPLMAFIVSEKAAGGCQNRAARSEEKIEWNVIRQQSRKH